MDYSQIPLRDMQMPEAIGWWPLAYGWWVVLIIVLISLVYLARYLRKKLSDPRRYALRELKSIEQAYSQHQDTNQLIMQSNSLLKRLALSLYPREQVASLSGDNWCQFLQDTGGVSVEVARELLAKGPYQRQRSDRIDHTRLIQFCRQWIKQVKGAKYA
ncbi:DUF4381 domain-containing protein [Neptuniibacter sp. 1_MG-2023]|jgi:hypothetical protein|uniref:DUF4381 domain-containing protein n=1 Tax=Neptuniibacter sp. 1_MG-2023 TaxID=3062662 RepID=UPI0026E19E0F|nr:DUF4381 domain-containing protein [Neptuniibacter sp. 1_MG-2023]MDO6594704.1 DUF4381 domain-containing protein [Neptuniibacter sp. 1_MG-2023]